MRTCASQLDAGNDIADGIDRGVREALLTKLGLDKNSKDKLKGVTERRLQCRASAPGRRPLQAGLNIPAGFAPGPEMTL